MRIVWMLNVCLTVFELSGGFALNYYFEKGESISLSIDRMEFFDDFLFSLCELLFYEGCNIFQHYQVNPARVTYPLS